MSDRKEKKSKKEKKEKEGTRRKRELLSGYKCKESKVGTVSKINKLFKNVWDVWRNWKNVSMNWYLSIFLIFDRLIYGVVFFSSTLGFDYFINFFFWFFKKNVIFQLQFFFSNEIDSMDGHNIYYIKLFDDYIFKFYKKIFKLFMLFFSSFLKSWKMKVLKLNWVFFSQFWKKWSI